MEPSTTIRGLNDEISLHELVEVLRQDKWLFLSIAIACTLIAAIAAFVVPKTYTAEILVSPVSQTGDQQQGALGSIGSTLGGLVSLAGISVTSDVKKSEFVAVLRSESLTQRYIETNNLLPVLYARKWNADKKSWNETDRESIPTVWEANQFFRRKVRSVSTDAKTGLVTMKITWKDPKVAARWANDLVHMANTYLRDKALAETERNIAYLNAEAAKTDIVTLKTAIYSLLQSEIKTAMLARGTDEYAFKVIDIATPPEKPTSPKPRAWTLVGLAVGIGLPLLMAFIRVAWR